MQFAFNKKTFAVPIMPNEIKDAAQSRDMIYNIVKFLSGLVGSIIQVQVVGDNPPALKTSIGVAGQLETDGDYLYLCVASGNWIRFTKDATY